MAAWDAIGTQAFSAAAGIHYRSAIDDGVKIGKQVGTHVLDHHFHKSDD